MPPRLPLVLYHANCWDGFCAAFVLWKHYDGAIDARPVRYGDPLPDPLDTVVRSVFVVDFSWPLVELRALAAESARLHVLDHHRTAITALRGQSLGPFATLDLREDWSGAHLVWSRYGPTETLPWLVAYTEDRDLWRWALPDTREINAALRSYPLDFELWDSWGPDVPPTFVAEGAAILRAEAAVIERHVRHAQRNVPFAGHEHVSVVNATSLQSEIGHALAKDAFFAVCWFEDRHGDTVYSLRSAEHGADVSAIAARFGGGGHVHAAGFTLPRGVPRP